MSVAVITGSAGLVGSEAARFFADLGFDIVGIDNDMRSAYLGIEGSTLANRERLKQDLGSRYSHRNVDVRDNAAIKNLFQRYGNAISLVIHAAAQPSHDWSLSEPMVDFTVNANGTQSMLEATRQLAPQAVFIFTSSNKVYGDSPNCLPLLEMETRWEVDSANARWEGIDETLSLDRSLHSPFGASKLAADVMVQEYGRSYGLRTVCFRCGCLTGPSQAGTRLHGFLAYLARCATIGREYVVYGYEGKQVRDNLHSSDLIKAFHEFYRRPQSAAVYNLGGGRSSNCSIREALQLCQEITGREAVWRYTAQHRKGDHRWWITNNAQFMADYPDWRVTLGIREIMESIFDGNREHWEAARTIA